MTYAQRTSTISEIIEIILLLSFSDQLVLMKWNYGIVRTGIQAKPADGGIASILKSLKNFSSSDLQLAKENLVLLRPAVVGCTCPSTPLKMQKALEAARILQSPLPKPGLSGDYYQCNHCSRLTKARIKGTTCETCKSKFGERDSYSRGPYSVFEKEPDRSTAYSTGFVKVNTTCIVTDNLEIMPLTTTRSMSVLSTLKVDSLADLEVNEVTVNITQVNNSNVNSHVRNVDNVCMNIFVQLFFNFQIKQSMYLTGSWQMSNTGWNSNRSRLGIWDKHS